MLTGKQKRQLRARANQLKSTVTIGKDGITPRVIKFIDQDFQTKELVKIKVLKSCLGEWDDLINRLTTLHNTELVQTLGHTILLHRPLPQADTENDRKK